MRSMDASEIILSVAIPILIGAGFALAALTNGSPKEFLAARVSFVIAGFLGSGLTLYWLGNSDRPGVERVVIGAIVIGLSIVCTLAAVQWVGRREARSGLPTASPQDTTHPQADLPLYDAVDRVKSRVRANEDVERLLRDVLSLGQLQSWARPLKTRGESALEPIPPETWRDRTFVIVRPPGRRPHTWIAWSGVHGRPYIYSDVRVSSAQVDDLWPNLKETDPRRGRRGR
jgi:hypothetical protein